MPTDRPRVYITCDDPDIEALEALFRGKLQGMGSRGNVALACLRAGLAVLSRSPEKAALLGPGGSGYVESDSKRKR